MNGRIYRKNTADDITPYFNFNIEDEEGLKRLSDFNNKIYTEDEIIQRIKSGIRACKMNIMSPTEFYHIVKSLVE